MDDDELQTAVEDATLDFTLGESSLAIEKLTRAVSVRPDSFAAWHALAEVHFSLRNYDDALSAAETASSLEPDDLHINTSLSRIWMEKGDKTRAEEFGAKARMLGWKDELKERPPEDSAP